MVMPDRNGACSARLSAEERVESLRVVVTVQLRSGQGGGLEDGRAGFNLPDNAQLVAKAVVLDRH
jgi:hypothetical protein